MVGFHRCPALTLPYPLLVCLDITHHGATEVVYLPLDSPSGWADFGLVETAKDMAKVASRTRGERGIPGGPVSQTLKLHGSVSSKVHSVIQPNPTPAGAGDLHPQLPRSRSQENRMVDCSPRTSREWRLQRGHPNRSVTIVRINAGNLYPPITVNAPHNGERRGRIYPVQASSAQTRSSSTPNMGAVNERSRTKSRTDCDPRF